MPLSASAGDVQRAEECAKDFIAWVSHHMARLPDTSAEDFYALRDDLLAALYALRPEDDQAFQERIWAMVKQGLDAADAGG